MSHGLRHRLLWPWDFPQPSPLDAPPPLRGPSHRSTLCSPPLLCGLLKGLHHHAASVGLDVPAGSPGHTLQAQPTASDPNPCPSGVLGPHSLSGCSPDPTRSF